MRILLLLLLLAPLLACAGLPPGPDHPRVAAPPATTPIEVCWLEYARDVQPARRAHAGKSRRAEWTLTYSGLLVRHPKGHLLLDVGNSRTFRAELRGQKPFPRFFLKNGPGKNTPVATVGEALAAVGETEAQLQGAVISHIHADHAGGLVELRQVPVLLSPRELEFMTAMRDARTMHVLPAHDDAIRPRARPLEFTDTPYETFDRSVDWFGDGSVVFVELPGHTPGTLGTFIDLGQGRRLLHVGDAINSTEALTLRVGKSTIMAYTDHDDDAADRVVSQLAQLHALDPALAIVPAHDRTAWAAVFGDVPRCIATP